MEIGPRRTERVRTAAALLDRGPMFSLQLGQIKDREGPKRTG